MNDAVIVLDAVFWPTLVMGILLGIGVAFVRFLRPKRGY